MGQEQKWETLNIIWEGEDGETGRNKCPHLPLEGARTGLCFPGRWEGPPLDPIRHSSPESQARAHESGQGSNPGSAHAAECSLGLASPATILGLNCLLWKGEHLVGCKEERIQSSLCIAHHISHTLPVIASSSGPPGGPPERGATLLPHFTEWHPFLCGHCEEPGRCPPAEWPTGDSEEGASGAKPQGPYSPSRSSLWSQSFCGLALRG